ncbi:MAG: response regulator transcription factor [Dehalococcoidia bacterium]|nr:response regulator transcription factor [Dehalococcoidia bacterium]MCA9851671.1 response regulator transcription factor [Dehalococcoidia bacterium]MCA9855840.1 response regulator transcription factor [Dehalococcoidia bacterium]
MQRILILTQDPATARAVESVARVDGRVVRAEGTAERCLIAVREWRPSLVIVDTGLGMTSGGLSAILRDEAVEDTAAVMVLLPPSQLNLLGPNVHVDDFAVTPVNEEELRTRMSRLIWAQSGAEDGSVIRHGTLLIDLERYKVTVDGEVVDLTYKEYELLRFLASNPGKPFTREALLNQVWGYDYYGGSRTVDVHVRRIRSKIEQREQFIDTVRNVGYRFVETFGARR